MNDAPTALRETGRNVATEFTYAVEAFDSYADCQAHLDQIGSTVAKTRIEVTENQRALLHSAEAMSLHTDHPVVDVIAWYCVRQCDEGGESLLLDFEQISARLPPQQLVQLRNVNVKVPYVPALGPRSSVPLLSATGLYYAQWLIEDGASSASTAAVTAFQDALAQLSPVRIRLAEGQALIVNNKRVMHGRARIIQRHSRRLLLRHWIRYS